MDGFLFLVLALTAFGVGIGVLGHFRRLRDARDAAAEEASRRAAE